MKKSILLTAAILATVTFAIASDPINYTESCCPVVYESEAVEMSYDVQLFSEKFAPAYFNEETNALHFESHASIQYVQVYNESGKMEYQLPVMSNKIRMSKNMFEEGDYKLTFIFGDDSNSLDTYLRIN